MFKTLLSLLAISLLLVGCSSTPTDTEASLKGDQTALEAPSRSSESEDDTDLLLARKWQSEDGLLLLDLNLDGTFVGEVDGAPVEGQWQISDDRKTLTLNESKGVEGKGQAINASYAIVSNSPESMILQDEDGKTWTLAVLD